MLPPGASLVLTLSLKALAIPTSIFVTLTFANVGLSFFGRLGAAITTSIIAVSAKYVYGRLAERRDLSRFGARLPPSVPTKHPLGKDLIEEMIEEQNRGHLGASWTRWTEDETLGHTSTLNVMGDRLIVTIEPDYVKRLLATEFDNFEKGQNFIYAMDSLLGVGVFNSDGDMWKFHRAMTRPFFSRERISDFEIFARHTDEALEVFRARLREGEAVDFQDLVSRFTLDSATEFLFGSCVSSLSDPLPYSSVSRTHVVNTNTVSEQFAKAFARAGDLVSHRLRMGWIWPLGEILKDKSTEDIATIKAFIAPMIDKAIDQEIARKKMNQSPFGAIDVSAEKVEEGETLLAHLVKQTNDRKLLQDESLNLLVAGRDTTASTLTFAVYALIMYPKVLAKLREEIMTEIGPSRNPTYDDIRNMKYLRAFINETLRVFPPVPFDIRATKKATVWPSPTPGEKPYYIPAKTNVNYSLLIMHRNTKYWGPDANEFDPERWLDDRLHKYLIPNPYIFLPFNAGPRICLGQQFAYNESSFFLIRLIQGFDDFTLAEDARPPEAVPPPEWKNLPGRPAIENVVIKSNLTSYARGGLWVRMKEAKED